MVANYATQAFTSTLSGAAYFVEQGAKRDTVTDAAAIALWSANFTATPPAAGPAMTGVLAQYLASYPNGPQVT